MGDASKPPASRRRSRATHSDPAHPRNPWLAIDASTPAPQRARELRRAWEHFVAEGEPEAVREPIVESWRRSQAAGVDPSGARLAPVVADEDQATALWEAHPLAGAASLIHECLVDAAEASGHLIVVSDADGVLLWVEGNAQARLAAAESMNFAEGALWSEGGAGTNAIGTALAADHAVQVFAAEHFHEIVQAWTCAAAPVHDPDSGRLLGIIDLTGRMSTVHPYSLSLAAATARAVESHLRCQMHERDTRTIARYGTRLTESAGHCVLVSAGGRVIAGNEGNWLPHDRLAIPPGGGELTEGPGLRLFAEELGGDRAYLVRRLEVPGARPRDPVVRLSLLRPDRAAADVGGRRLRLRRRHSEILALLRAHPDGMSAEALCADLYGDGGQPSSVRVEVSRLRKLLGPCIDLERYRLVGPVESDVDRVEGLLRRGAVREAVEHYPGPLLPGSDAPGVRRQRDELDAWVRQAVMTAGDTEALWAWLQCPSGQDDLAAWLRLLGAVDFRDTRRSLATARVAALRAERALLA